MLLHRSILSKVCILLAICLVKAQYEYDKEEKKEVKEVKEEDEEDRDYEKIFAHETSAALTAAATEEEDPESPKQSDFVTPAEFENYFKPSHIFGESNEEVVKASPEKKKKEQLQTFESKRENFPSYLDDGPLKDFFEKSEERQQKLQKEQSNKEEEVLRPGPSYISHQVPAHYGYDDEEDDKSPSASEDVERAPRKNKEKKNNYEPNFEEGRVEKNDADYKLPPFTFEPLKNNKPKVDYDTGKSSSTVSQYPAASGYAKPAPATPYEQYSFQPKEDYEAENSKFFDSIISTVKPYNPTYKQNTEPKYETQSTENAPSQQQAKGCRKVVSSDASDDMNCFICENPKTNAKYTQCSYSSQKKPINFYEGNTAKYSNMPEKQEAGAYRYKRYAENEENDPYTYIRNRARKSDKGIPSDYGSGFQYEAEHYDESKPGLTFSEQHSEDIKKNPDNCRKVEKDGMTCTICKDSKSGGNFEQCSYTSKPKEKKYAYVTEKKFENDEPVETQVVSQTKAAETKEKENSDGATKKNTEFVEEYQSRNNKEKAPKKRNEEGRREEYQAKPSENTEKKDKEGYQYPSYFVKSISSPSYDDSIIYKGSSSDKVDAKQKSDYSDFDEYHFKYFPEFAKHESKLESKQESRQEPVQNKYEVPVPEATKQNVESVLAEFTKKDRSNCKKAEKKGMTCFLCVDKNNIQNEECMYVQESKPETKHVAYHESSEKAKLPEKQANNTAESKQETKLEPAVTETKNKYFFKNVPSAAPPLGLEAAASEMVGTFVRYTPSRSKRSTKKNSKDEEEPKPDESAYDAERLDDKADPTIKTPEEFNVAPGEGAFSEETKNVYSKELGVQLPKYMLDKSEFEKEFDAFSGSF